MSNATFIKVKAIRGKTDQVMVYARHTCREKEGQRLHVIFYASLAANWRKPGFGAEQSCECDVVVPPAIWDQWHQRFQFMKRLEGE